jgi:HrpA-like RNA helicase
MYSKQEYSKMEENSLPEILRSDLLGFVIKMISLKEILRLEKWVDVIDEPSRSMVDCALERLILLRIIKDGKLTEDGKIISKLPLDPVLGKVVVEGTKLGCGRECAALISMIYIEFNERCFESQKCDFSKLIFLFFEFLSERNKKQFCKRFSFRYESFVLGLKVYKQVIGMLNISGDNRRIELNKIHEVLTRSLFINLSKRVGASRYYSKLLYGKGSHMVINPLSAVNDPEYVIYYQLKGKERMMMYLMGIEESDVLRIKDFMNLGEDA